MSTDDILIGDQIVSVCSENGKQKTAIKILVVPGESNPLAEENQINATESGQATDSADPE